MRSSIRRSSFSQNTTSNPQNEPSEFSESASSRHNHLVQDQFINGQPTASLNGQQPGYVRTFSRSHFQNAQYDAETTPNIAYIERTVSMSSQHARRRLQAMNGLQELSHETKTIDIRRAISDPLRSGNALHLEPRATPELMDNGGSVGMDELAPRKRISRASFSSEAYDQSERDQEQSITRILATSTKDNELLEVRRAQNHSRVSDYNTSAEMHKSSLAGAERRRAERNRSSLKHASIFASGTMTVDEMGMGETEQKMKSANQESHGQVIDEGDYFGDTIMSDDRQTPPIPPRSHLRSRSSTPDIGTARAIRLFPTNPDPPSSSNTDEDLPSRAIHIDIAQRQPSYRCRKPVQPLSTSYPSPLRRHSWNRRGTGRSKTKTEKQDDIPVPALQTQTWRKPRFFPNTVWNWYRDRQPGTEETQGHEDFVACLSYDTVPSHWALYLSQGFIWVVLVVYFFWRVSKLKNTVSFDCYELKTQLLHLGENMTVSIGNFTIGNATVTHAVLTNGTNDAPTNETLPTSHKLLSNKWRNASSILIPKEFHAKLKAHCILQPISPAVVLASYFEILFLMALVACCLAYLLQVLALQQLRPWMQKSGVHGSRTLVMRIGVQILAAGIASMGVASTAWAIKGGW